MKQFTTESSGGWREGKGKGKGERERERERERLGEVCLCIKCKLYILSATDECHLHT